MICRSAYRSGVVGELGLAHKRTDPLHLFFYVYLEKLVVHLTKRLYVTVELLYNKLQATGQGSLAGTILGIDFSLRSIQ